MIDDLTDSNNGDFQKMKKKPVSLINPAVAQGEE